MDLISASVLVLASTFMLGFLILSYLDYKRGDEP